MHSELRDPLMVLFDRADRAIADAVVLRRTVQEELTMARQAHVCRPSADDWPPFEEPPLYPFSLRDIEPWWRLARAALPANAIVADVAGRLELAWRRVLPTLRTPLTLLQE